jgi:hypothetical protein
MVATSGLAFAADIQVSRSTKAAKSARVPMTARLCQSWSDRQQFEVIAAHLWSRHDPAVGVLNGSRAIFWKKP